MKNLWPLLGVLLLAGCDDVRLEPRFKFVPRFGEKSPSAALAEDIETRLAELDAELARLEADISGKSGATRRELKEQLDDLERQKRGLEAAVRDARNAGDEAIRDVRRTTSEVLRDLERGLKRLDEKVASSR